MGKSIRIESRLVPKSQEHALIFLNKVLYFPVDHYLRQLTIVMGTVDNNKDKHTVTGTAARAGLLLLFDCRRRGSGFCGGLNKVLYFCVDHYLRQLMILMSTVDTNKDKHTVIGTAAPAGLLLVFDCRRRGSGFCGGLSGERSPPRSASYGPEMETHKYECKQRLKKYLRN